MGFGNEQTSLLISLLNSPFIIILFFWDVVWKTVALWKAARQNQLYWFVAIAILNTVGILPIIYLVFFQKEKVKEKK